MREAFVRLYEQGLIYRGAYIVNWCPRCQTAISDLEVIHEEQQGKLWEIRYPVVTGKDGFVTVATTRPETMLGDVAVAVHPDDERYAHLHGKMLRLPLTGREIPVVTDSWVSRDFGTGAVKVTPAHDPNDFALGQRQGLPSISVMDETAHMSAAAGAYAGLDRYKARQRVLEDLEAENLLAGVREHVNSIGKCDRCKTVVEPLLSTQWFIRIQPLADKAIAAVEAGLHPLYARTILEDVLRVDAQYPRLVHLAATVVGASHSGVALRCLRQNYRGPHHARSMCALPQPAHRAGEGCSGHLVLFRAVALLLARVAGTQRLTWTLSIPPGCWSPASTSCSSGSRA